MTLHPDILTDLVILYHAGEASQATRALLEAEGAGNPQLAAALAARPRNTAPPPMPPDPALDERKVFRRVRTRYQAISFAVVWTLVLLAIAFSPRLFTTTVNSTPLIIALLPFQLLIMIFAGALAALFFFLRGVLR